MNRYQEATLRYFDERPDAAFCHLVGDDGETVLTWRDLAADCGRSSAAYRGAGLTAGDQALIFLRHTPQLYGSFLGALLTGVTPAFMPCSSPRQDPSVCWSSHQALLGKIRPTAIVTDRTTLAEMGDSRWELEGSRIVLADDRRRRRSALPPWPKRPSPCCNTVPAPPALRAYDSVGQARASLGRYLAFYNGKRPHSSLGARTPDQAYFNHQPLARAA